ncbi:MAG TPA: response regulator [Clostridia bacterium]|nr:response regulator [Clostridia bacterium]
MYKLILVDDENDVREGILQEIDWRAIGFEVVGTAENGKEAYDLLERLVPDIVVTDIKMPFMDGLVLSELIRQKYPDTRIVILTGFDEFEFAQKAIRLHVDEYVLKPFSSQELVQVLVRIKQLMDEETAEKKNILKLKELYNESLPVLKANFLTLLITKKLDKKEILEKSNKLEIDLCKKGFVISVIRPDLSRLNLSAEQPEAGQTEESETGFQVGDGDLALLAVLNIAAEHVEKYGLGIVFIHNGDIVVISLSDEGEESIIDKTLKALEEIRYSVEKYLKLTVTAGIGTYSDSVNGISNSYKDACLALDYKFLLGNNRIILISDLEPRAAGKAVFDELRQEALSCCIKVGAFPKVEKLIDTVFRDLSEAGASFRECQVYLMEIMISILKIAKDSDIDIDCIIDENFNLFPELCRFNNLQEARDWMLGVCTRVMNLISGSRQNNCRQIVSNAKEFTRNHYHESDLTINRVCGYLHVSPGYFSTIFKRETKSTYLAYLVQLRMDTAKELLRMTELKSFEIAERIGFSDANYFSNSFKKYTGHSPSEYRNRK